MMAPFWTNFIEPLRPKQWIKNLFLFLPLFFGGKLTDIHALKETVITFVGFCFLTSAIYLLNDIVDRKEDLLHPKKRHRAIASGKLSVRNALIECCILFIFSILLFLCLQNRTEAFVWWIAYLIMMIAYSLWLKKISIVDVAIIACGFVFRLYLGSAVTDIFLSNWIIIFVFILALLLAFGKRRDDLNNLNENNAVSRKNIHAYSIEYLNVILSLLSAIIIVIYILYTFSPEITERISPNLFFTIPFVIMGIFRYLQIVLVEENEFNPTDILWKDRFLQLTIVGWLLLFSYFLYFS